MEKQQLYLPLFLLTLCLAPYAALAQKGTKTIVDANNKLPLDYVSIQSDNNSIKLLSNKDGKFIFVEDGKLKSFKFYKMGYAPLTLPVAELLASDTVFLIPRQIELNEVTVRNNKLDTLVKDKRYYVEDYAVLPNENFLILTYKSEPNDVEVCYYDQSRGICQAKKIRGEPGAHFVTDCFSNLHVLTDNYSRQVFFESDTSFGFLPKYPRKTFDSTLAACVLKLDTQVIMKRCLPPAPVALPHFTVAQNAPFLTYVRVSRHARELFYTAEYNARMREMIKNEVSDFLLMGGAIDYRTECNIILFFNKIAAPIYAPLFLKNDTVVLFNFQEGSIAFLDRLGTQLKQVKLDEKQFATMRDFEIIHDAGVHKFYVKMRESDRAVLKQIDIYSGKITRTLKLEKIFAKNIQVVNNKLYYLVREKGWDDTQYLYQQN